MVDIDNEVKTRPFLRWAGGKRWLLRYFDGLDYTLFNNYHEPFVGGGAFFFNSDFKKKVFLSDLNEDLIYTYKSIQTEVDEVISHLKTFHNSEEQYYHIRAAKFRSTAKKAARFIYLNKTSFNGIYRVNNNGQYNVPYGFIKSVDFVDSENLKRVCEKLKNVEIKSCDFYTTLRSIKKNDLVFLDPPYTVAHENNGFIEYNKKIFSLKDQIRLAKMIKYIAHKGAFFILTNAKHIKVKEIYKSIGVPISISRPSTVGGIGAQRKIIKEYIFTNIDSLKGKSKIRSEK